MKSKDAPGISAAEFDAKFEAGEDVTEYLDLDSTRRPNREEEQVHVGFPTWMVESLDREAGRIGVSRQALIKVWIAERLERPA